MVNQVADASSVLGAETDTTGLTELTKGDYSRAVTENLPRDYVRMYHPDNTSSIVQLPPLGKNGKGAGDRQRKIMHYILNKKIRGQQWWFASPPPGWQEKTPRYSCFLVGCDRNREPNLHSLYDLYTHFTHKHHDETKLYEGVLKAIQQKLSAEIPPELAEQLGLAANTKSLDDAQFAQVMTGEHLVPPAAMQDMLADDAATELVQRDCDVCGWKNEKNTAAGLEIHKTRWCKRTEVLA
jgi:hypothetical protein